MFINILLGRCYFYSFVLAPTSFSKFSVPFPRHYAITHHVLRYLNGTKSYRLHYGVKNLKDDSEALSDLNGSQEQLTQEITWLNAELVN